MEARVKFLRPDWRERLKRIWDKPLTSCQGRHVCSLAYRKDFNSTGCLLNSTGCLLLTRESPFQCPAKTRQPAIPKPRYKKVKACSKKSIDKP